MSDTDPIALPRLVTAEAVSVRVPFRRPLLGATGEFTHRRAWLLRVVTEDGREGLGEAALNPFAEEVTTAALAMLMREIVPALAAGRMPVWSELAGEGEPGRAAMAAVDGAVMSLAEARRPGAPGSGVAAGPLAAGPLASAAAAGPLAAGPVAAGPVAAESATPSPAPIPVVALIGFGGPDAGADAAVQAVELGFETLKLRAGFERTTDQLVDRLRAIRGAVGPEPRLRVDAGGAWDLGTATERILAMEPFRIEFVEQPLATRELAGHAALRERTGIPIALDEEIESEGAAGAALAEGAADVIVVKPARVGGLAATLRIATAASAAGASVVLGTYFETGVGIAAVLRVAAVLRTAAVPRAAEGLRAADRRGSGTRSGGDHAHSLATAGILAHDLLRVPLPIERGRMAVPAAISLDDAEVDRYTLERFEVRG
jgi:L-alanine-DL-glutamate epimerase-like enolase superfamily enzyme